MCGKVYWYTQDYYGILNQMCLNHQTKTCIALFLKITFVSPIYYI